MGIDKTAVVSSSAVIDPSAEIGPGVVIEGDVKIGANVRIMPYANICEGTEIGENTKIHTGAVIGNEPQDLSFTGEKSFTRIGKNTVIREYVTIHRGTGEGTATEVGDNNYLMVQVHLGHNCKLEDNVIIANSALLAGHVEVGKGSFISGGVVFHQFCRLGRYVMVGGFTGVNKDVPPYMIVRGPSMVRGVNLVGLRRGGFSRGAIKEIKEAYKLLYLEDLPTGDALEKIRAISDSPELEHFVSFVEGSKRGICKYKYSRDEYFE